LSVKRRGASVLDSIPSTRPVTVECAGVRECPPNGAVILRAWVDAARATRRGLTRKEPVFERHG